MNVVIIQSVAQHEQHAMLFCLTRTAACACLSALSPRRARLLMSPLLLMPEVRSQSCPPLLGRTGLLRQSLPHTLLCALTQTQTTVCWQLLGDTHGLLLSSTLPPGLKVNRLDMYGEKYKPFKGIKYMTKAGKFQVRT